MNWAEVEKLKQRVVALETKVATLEAKLKQASEAADSVAAPETPPATTQPGMSSPDQSEDSQ